MDEKPLLDVYADSISVTRSGLGFTLDFLRSNPALPTTGGPSLQVQMEPVCRVRCSSDFVKLMTQLLSQGLNDPAAPVEIATQHREGRVQMTALTSEEATPPQATPSQPPKTPA